MDPSPQTKQQTISEDASQSRGSMMPPRWGSQVKVLGFYLCKGERSELNTAKCYISYLLTRTRTHTSCTTPSGSQRRSTQRRAVAVVRALYSAWLTRGVKMSQANLVIPTTYQIEHLRRDAPLPCARVEVLSIDSNSVTAKLVIIGHFAT